MATEERPEHPVIPTRTVETGLELAVAGDGVDWTAGAERLNHPDEVRTLVLNENDVEDRLDLLVEFPPGYESPEHAHEAAHAVLVLAGEMVFDDGTVLGPGDYMYGQREPHGMRFPEGATVFASFTGGSPAHEWADDRPGVR